ncbi:ATP-binding protein [Mucilaginibacter sp. KACC 22063]|uniref:ATP-binding protein n=1 Tax=Mucilaginibacter sp. KACC 22063 TaxID=3025666 RepID=UPI0023672321|nr:ATP-binding protein [Mucilaginibacter sp. KACC 22063]WDF55775.1 ATP-binding protein [Mucilaginibacter sp. KACC 22063]
MADDLKPHIGKRVIETLTSGMYDDSRFVFREYVQNAADQIDVAVETGVLAKKADGKISITIDVPGQKINVYDNATGISGKDVTKFLGDVANSQKDREKRKGFRGIGRLGGLGYCDKLIFETSFKNEDFKSIMSLDAKMLRSIIEDNSNDLDASSVISVITSIKRESERKESHFFKITLERVSTEKILDIGSVTDYLSMVAPLPFNKEFTSAEEINAFFKKNNFILDEYHVEINGKQIFKPYKNTFQEEKVTSELIGIEFFQVRDDDSELLALGWCGFRNLSNNVLPTTVKERGLRLRKSNIALGDETTLNRFFKIERTNLRFIGELHIISNGFIPNARRDYFNENTTLQTFEKKLTEIFLSENWENRLAQTASQLHNRVQDIKRYQAASQQYEAMKEKGAFEDAAEEKVYVDSMRQSQQKAQKAIKAINKIQQNTEKDKTVAKLYDSIVGQENLAIPDGDDIVLNTYDPPIFRKLKKNEQDVVRDIFTIIEENLKPEDAKKLKRLILEKYN